MVRPKKHNKHIYKSGFENNFQLACKEQGWNLPYEQDRIKYVIPSKTHTYTPDFTVTKNVYVETKGLWPAVERKKALFIQEQFPEIKILYVLYRNQKLFKTSTTTYLEWAKNNGLKACTFADTKTWMQFIKDHIND
jgi:hypothetical protein